MARKGTPRRPRKADVKAAADRAEKRTKGETVETAKVPVDPPIISAKEIADEVATKMGRPTKYRPEYARVAQALCRRGATDFELAEEFGVSTSTIWRWSCQHDDFWIALHVNKNQFDDRVERALAQRAVGYSYHSEKVFNFQGEIVRAKTVEHVPGDVGAAKMWLTNRRPDKWQDISKREMGGPGDFDRMSDDELNEYIAKEAEELIQAGGSGKGKTH